MLIKFIRLANIGWRTTWWNFVQNITSFRMSKATEGSLFPTFTLAQKDLHMLGRFAKRPHHAQGNFLNEIFEKIIYEC